MADSFHFDFADTKADDQANVPVEDFTMNHEKIEWTYSKSDGKGAGYTEVEWTYSKLDGQSDSYTEVEWTYAKGDIDPSGYVEVEWTY